MTSLSRAMREITWVAARRLESRRDVAPAGLRTFQEGRRNAFPLPS